MTKWNYVGDVNLREGGYYWREDDADDYVLAVEVTPCSAAGGPDNLFWINEGSVYITPERAALALESCDINPDDATRADVVDSIIGYYGIERDAETTLRIGKPEADPDQWRFDSSNMEVDVVLRAGSSLENWVKRECLR